MNIKSFLAISSASLMLLACKSNTNENMSTLNLTQEWDKTFPKSELVNHSKVTFHNRYGIELAADMYVPKNAEGRLPALAVSGPFGAVKEQSSGLYAQHMAERGERIGIIGICGFGGMAINAAALDPRIKATVASTMYDMSKVNVEGYFASEDTPAQRQEKRKALAEQRTKDYAAGTYQRAGGVIDPLPEDAPWFVKDYHAYYKTPRGYHKRSGNSTDGWNVIGCQSFLNQPLLAWAGEIENPVLLIHGEKAHSRYFSEYAYGLLTGRNKEIMIIPGVSHVDLYDDVAGVIPYDKIERFFKTNLK